MDSQTWSTKILVTKCISTITYFQIMKATNASFNGIDIGTAYICWARGVPRDKLISNVGIQPLPSGSAAWWDAVKEGFSDLVATVKLGREEAAFSLPAEFSLIKRVRMDAAEADPHSVLEWELSQQMPGEPDDFAWNSEETSLAGQSREFLVAGYRRGIINQAKALCHQSKLKLSAIDIDAFALVNVFEINYPERLAEYVCIVQIDLQRTKVILCRTGHFVDIETFDHSPDMKAVESYAEVLLRNVARLSEISGTEPSPSIFLSGCGLMQEGLALSLCDAIPGAEVLNPFRAVTCNVTMTEEELRTYSPQLAVAVGLALSPRGRD